MVIRRIKGDTYPVQVQVLSEDGTEFDLTGCETFFTVKKRIEDTDSQALISKSTTSHTSATEGITSFSLNYWDVDYEGSFFYDVKVKDALGVIYSVSTDSIIFQRHTTIRTS
jgi:hypothetical protein